MSSEVVIRAKGLAKVYRLYRRPEDRLKELIFSTRSLGQDFWALRDIDLEIRRGEAIGIIGRNGSGKSTLLQLICGTAQPTTGELEVRGRVAALLELGVGFDPEFTGRENVYLSAIVLGLSEAEITERFAAIEAFAGIGNFIDQPVRQYSSGMYARLAFAVCAHVDADILAVDEILAVGDAGFQQRCMRFLRSFRARGTLVFVSHDENAVLSLCDRAVWLDRGVIRADGACKEVCRRYRILVSQKAGNGDAFEVGGVGDRPPSSAATSGDTDASPRTFDFGIDAGWVRSGKRMIEHATLLTAQGQAVVVAEGGSEVMLCIDVRAARSLAETIVAFVLRNRLGQNIFCDSTASLAHRVPARIKEGQSFRTTFRFRLPHLPSGDYAIEAALYERTDSGPVDLLLDSLFVRIDSGPYLEGLANLTMRQTRLIIGNGTSVREITATTPAAAIPLVDDIRWRGRNPMELLPFNPDAPFHGHGGAKIEDAGFYDSNGSRVNHIQGGDELELRIHARAHRDLAEPILGFMLRNAFGQNICGDNTFLASRDADRSTAEGQSLAAHFRFQMPYLPAGNYTLAPSIIDGIQQDHIHLHWMEEALTLRVAKSPVSQGVVGVPMLDIRFELDPVARPLGKAYMTN
jgi:lipopolysaccharide transport system ATP-binding protein